MVKATLRLKKGDMESRVPVKFDSGAHVAEFYRLHTEVIKAELAMKKNPTDATCNAYGDAIMALYGLVLGKENARNVENWFGTDMLSMVTQVNTFIKDIVIPDLEICSKLARKRMTKQFLQQQKRAVKHASK